MEVWSVYIFTKNVDQNSITLSSNSTYVALCTGRTYEFVMVERRALGAFFKAINLGFVREANIAVTVKAPDGHSKMIGSIEITIS